jgi:hypothetical protein
LIMNGLARCDKKLDFQHKDRFIKYEEVAMSPLHLTERILLYAFGSPLKFPFEKLQIRSES